MDKQHFTTLVASLTARQFTDEQRNILLNAAEAATEVDDFCTQSYQSFEEYFAKDRINILPIWVVAANPEYAWHGWVLSLFTFRRLDGGVFTGFTLSNMESDTHHVVITLEDEVWSAVAKLAPDTFNARHFFRDAGCWVPGAIRPGGGQEGPGRRPATGAAGSQGPVAERRRAGARRVRFCPGGGVPFQAPD